jgi:hypothetical protein
MKAVLWILAAAALIATILPAVLYLTGNLSKSDAQWFMLMATVVWFAVAPFCNRAGPRKDV